MKIKNINLRLPFSLIDGLLNKVRPCTRSDLARKKQRGSSSVYIILLIIIIGFAIMLSGGGSSLFSGNEASPVPPETPTPPISEPSPTPPPASNIWSISVEFLGCNINGIPRAKIISTGDKNGYINYEVDDGTGKFVEIATGKFIAPQSVNHVVLLNKDGFNKRSWKANLFSGGILASEKWSGGTLKATYNGSPTNCQ